MSVHALKLPQTSRNVLKHVYDGLTYMSTYVFICIYMFLIHANTVIRSERTVTMTSRFELQYFVGYLKPRCEVDTRKP